MNDEERRENASSPGFTRREVIGAAGAAVGALTVGSRASASQWPRPGIRETNSVRVAAVSYLPPFHDHRKDGVNLEPLRAMTARVAQERPQFVCFPEICACAAAGFHRGPDIAPELGPYVAEVGKIAREFDTAIVAPLLERLDGKVYNSVPVVDRHGRLVLVYRKNYLTPLEMEVGISPGTEVPVGDCDGVRVGVSVCFDANFESVALELERQRARLMFWPSQYWGGQLLQYWAMRYGFYIAVAYDVESALIDMSGRYLVRQGTETWQVRAGHLPPWAVADININRELFHLDGNMKKFQEIRAKYTPDIEIEVMEPEGFFLLSSRRPDLPVEQVASEFGLETLRDFLARSSKMRADRVAR